MKTQDYDGNIITGEPSPTQIRLRDKLAIGLRNIRLIDSGVEREGGFEEYNQQPSEALFEEGTL
jgi:hypothetical protein